MMVRKCACLRALWTSSEKKSGASECVGAVAAALNRWRHWNFGQVPWMGSDAI